MDQIGSYLWINLLGKVFAQWHKEEHRCSGFSQIGDNED